MFAVACIREDSSTCVGIWGSFEQYHDALKFIYDRHSGLKDIRTINSYRVRCHFPNFLVYNYYIAALTPAQKEEPLKLSNNFVEIPITQKLDERIVPLDDEDALEERVAVIENDVRALIDRIMDGLEDLTRRANETDNELVSLNNE